MSILLDAVTKSKQQHSEVTDPALSPRQQYVELQSKNTLPIKVGVSVFGLLFAIAGAWWFAIGQNPKVAVVEGNTIVSNAEPRKIEKLNVPIGVEKAEPKESSVELAGKSALPIAQMYSASSGQIKTAKSADSNRADIHSETNVQVAPLPVKDDVQPSYVDHSSSQKPIILGRQPTEDELAIIHSDAKNKSSYGSQNLEASTQKKLSLEALKRQIAAAASDVGLKSKAQTQQDKLVKELDAQLRNTEHRKSVQSLDKNDSMMQGIPATKYPNVPSYGELPAGVQLQVPEFSISAHMYSSIPSQRRLSVNGRELKEGDKIKGKLKILEIRPRDVVLEVAGEKFRVPSI